MLTIKNSLKAAGIAAFVLLLALPHDAGAQAVNGQPAPSNGTMIFGVTPTNTSRRVNVDANGNVITTPLAGGLTDVNVTRIGGAAPSATVSLPVRLTTGAAFYDGATETTAAAMSAKLPASVGAKTAAASLSVVAPSDVPLAVAVTSLPLPAGAATDATLAALLRGTCANVLYGQATINDASGATAIGVLANRDYIRITNNSTSTSPIFCGTSGVTASGAGVGERLDVSAGFPYPVGTTVWACITAAAGAATVSWFACDLP